MSTQGVSLNVNGLVLKNVQDIEAALKANQITAEQANTYKALFNAPAQERPGTKVDHAETAEAKPEEERQKNEGAVKAQFDAIDAELKAAGHDPEKLRAAADKLDAFKKAHPDFKPEEQQAKNPNDPAKFKKVRTINTQFYNIDIYENGRAVYSPKVPTEQREVRSKKEIRQQIKADARYDDPNGLIDPSLKGKDGYVRGTDNLKAARKQVKEKRDEASDKLKDLNKQYNDARREYYKARKSGASAEQLAQLEAKYKALQKKKD